MNKQRLKEKYEKEVKSALAKEFDIKNLMAVPRIQKVVVNMGAGEMIKNKDLVNTVSAILATITGQKPSIRQAKTSIATFGLRKGMPVGVAVTLRGYKMYSFLDRLFSIVLPRLRDFRGVSMRSFDAGGNYTIGVNEHTVFPEIDIAKAGRSFGLEITIVINSGEREKSRRLLELLGMPFEKI